MLRSPFTRQYEDPTIEPEITEPDPGIGSAPVDTTVTIETSPTEGSSGQDTGDTSLDAGGGGEQGDEYLSPSQDPVGGVYEPPVTSPPVASPTPTTVPGSFASPYNPTSMEPFRTPDFGLNRGIAGGPVKMASMLGGGPFLGGGGAVFEDDSDMFRRAVRDTLSGR